VAAKKVTGVESVPDFETEVALLQNINHGIWMSNIKSERFSGIVRLFGIFFSGPQETYMVLYCAIGYLIQIR